MCVSMADREVQVQVFNKPLTPFQAEGWVMPALGPGELLVAIELATICGSDLHTYLGHRQEKVPAILGHEAVGRVIQGGRDGFNVGDRVTWSIADSCGDCTSCTSHYLPQKCTALFKYGHADTSNGTGLNGCYASHIVIRKGTHVVKVPDVLADGVVASANCALATVVNLLSKLPANIESVLVQGAGLLGLYACAMLKEQGVQHVFCVDVKPERLSLVEHFGGTPINGRDYKNEYQKIADLVPMGVDAVLELAGVASLVPAGIAALRNGGYYGFAGLVHPDSELDITGEQIIRKCLTLYGVHNYAPEHLDKAIQFLEKTISQYPYDKLVSPPYPLEKLDDAFAEAQQQQWCRVAVKP